MKIDDYVQANVVLNNTAIKGSKDIKLSVFLPRRRAGEIEV
jgi:hypothetical protein